MGKPAAAESKAMIGYRCLAPAIAFLVLLSCKMNDNVDMHAHVYITKTVDSLPCKVQIEYGDKKTKKNETIYSDEWWYNEYVYYDQHVALQATGISNVSHIKVEISVHDKSSSSICDSINCKASLVRDLRQDF